MRIGILTFQPSLNYGGILQCVALKSTLESMGHKVFVFNRWRDDLGDLVGGPYVKWGKRDWLRFFMRCVFCLGDFGKWLRYQRTKKYLGKNLTFLPGRFSCWADAPKTPDLDMIVVGSDQVWHCGDWGDPRPFLLDGAPEKPTIAYAASFGMAVIPQNLEAGLFCGKNIHDRYRAGLAKFSAISCREIEGVRICRDLGFTATHVVDPSLLPDLGSPLRSEKRILVGYLMTFSIDEIFVQMNRLERFACRFGCKIRLFVREGVFQNIQTLTFPKDISSARRWVAGIYHQLSSPVSLELGAGPKEFLDAFSKAKWVVTDSFHGLMFSIRNNCNVRVLRPMNANRATMFARIEEFAEHFSGNILVDGMDQALVSIECGDSVFFDYKWLSNWREKSRKWLENAINGAVL